MMLLSLLSSFESSFTSIMFSIFFYIFFFPSINLWYCVGILIWLMFDFKTGVVISNDPFLKLTLCMFWIVIFCKIMSPSKEHKHDNVTYMLCILSWILSSGWRRSMIECSKVCPWASKSFQQKNSSKYKLISTYIWKI